jgi:hypothetical protein
MTSPVLPAFTTAAVLGMPTSFIHAPVRVAEMVYARVSVRLTLASGGFGRYGRVWGVWHRAQLTPGFGYYQPDFQCAEYVMRCLRAAGYNIATPPPTSPNWVDLVNVDRAVSYLMARGIARPAPLSQLVAGDVVLFHYLRNGPDNWSHVALVEAVHPLKLSAHDRDRWAAPLSTYPPYQAIRGLHTVSNPTPPHGLAPLGSVAWGEVALRDPVLRATPAGAPGRSLYLGQLVHLSGAQRGPGSLTGWLHAQSGSLTGWLNGDAVTRLTSAPPLTAPGQEVLGDGRPRVVALPLPVRGAWGRNLYVDAQGCPVPAWTGTPCSAPYVVQGTDAYPAYTVTTAKPVVLTLSPVAGSVTVSRLMPGQSVAAERLGPYAVLFGVGGPAVAGGVLYAPASALTWHSGGVFEFLRATTYGGTTVPAATAAAVTAKGLAALYATFPAPPSTLSCPVWRPGTDVVARTAAQVPSCLYVPGGAPSASSETAANSA